MILIIERYLEFHFYTECMANQTIDSSIDLVSCRGKRRTFVLKGKNVSFQGESGEILLQLLAENPATKLNVACFFVIVARRSLPTCTYLLVNTVSYSSTAPLATKCAEENND